MFFGCPHSTYLCVKDIANCNMMFVVQTVGNKATVVDNFFNFFCFQYVTKSIIKHCVTKSAHIKHESTTGSGNAQKANLTVPSKHGSFHTETNCWLCFNVSHLLYNITSMKE